MSDELLADLDRLSAELLARLSRDEVGPPATTGSHMAGRMALAAAALENLLRAVVIHAAHCEGRPPEALLPLVGGKKPSFRKSMAGPLAHGLRAHFAKRPPGSFPVTIGVILDDLVRDESTILRFIAVRNDIVKEDGDPAGGRAVTVPLKALVQEFRRRARWK